MALDRITVSTPEGVGARVSNSIAGMLLGGVLFLASFAVLWWNEGNVIAEKNALDEMKSSLVKADVNAPKPAHEGKLIHGVGALTSKEKLGDAPYLKPGPYLKLERTVEMFQWVEDEQTSGSGSSKRKTYTYETKWAEGREASESFHTPAGHENPPLAVKPATREVKSATFGKLNGLPVIAHYEATDRLPLAAKLSGKDVGSIAEDRFYLATNKGKPNAPVVGDVRVSYVVVKPGAYSVIARQTGQSLNKHVAKNGKENFLVAAGKKAPAAMIQSAKDAAGTFAMILRAVGFFMMWFGMNLLAGPISLVLSFLPFVGAAGRFMLGIIFFVAAAILSLITIVVSMIAHHPILLALVVVGAVAAAIVAFQKRRSVAAAPAMAAPQARVAQPRQNKAA